MARIENGGIMMNVGGAWGDITESLDRVENPPFTLAIDQIGVGALQFSPAIYRGGANPNISIDVLQSLLREFSDNHDLADSFDNSSFSSNSFGVGASFHAESKLAGDPRNIQFVRGQTGNLEEHGGNFQNPTMGPLIDR
jgi:hypothetical protein